MSFNEGDNVRKECAMAAYVQKQDFTRCFSFTVKQLTEVMVMIGRLEKGFETVKQDEK